MRSASASLCFLALAACLPQSFDALEQAAPVSTVGIRFPGDSSAAIAIALSVDADDEGRGRVLFSDGEAQLGWLRLDERGAIELAYLADWARDDLTGTETPRFTALALIPDRNVPEALLRLAGEGELPDRIVRFRVADFSASGDAPIAVPEWVIASHPEAATLVGALGAAQLDEGQPELLSAAADGSLLVWPALGTELDAVAEARATLLAEDPEAFAGELASEGFGLTRCPGLGGGEATTIAAGALLAGPHPAAVILRGATLHFVAGFDPPQQTLVGSPRYDCEAGSIALPEPASSLLVVDLERDGDDDLLVGAPAGERVYVFLGQADAGLASTPDYELEPDSSAAGFGTSFARVDLGGGLEPMIAVGAPQALVGDTSQVGRVFLFALDGVPLRELADLEPRPDSNHGLGVHALGLPGRDELVVSGRRELRVHWQLFADDPRP